VVARQPSGERLTGGDARGDQLGRTAPLVRRGAERGIFSIAPRHWPPNGSTSGASPHHRAATHAQAHRGPDGGQVRRWRRLRMRVTVGDSVLLECQAIVWSTICPCRGQWGPSIGCARHIVSGRAGTEAETHSDRPVVGSIRQPRPASRSPPTPTSRRQVTSR
jgi:hypothetical protein